MIFGKSYGEKDTIEQAKLKEIYDAGRIKMYAWYPIQTNTGKWVWLAYVYKDPMLYTIGNRICKSSSSPIYYINKEGSE